LPFDSTGAFCETATFVMHDSHHFACLPIYVTSYNDNNCQRFWLDLYVLCCVTGSSTAFKVH